MYIIQLYPKCNKKVSPWSIMTYCDITMKVLRYLDATFKCNGKENE